MKRFAAGLLALLLLGALPKGNAQAAAETPEVAAGGAALMEMDSCRMLAGWNEHVKLPMASTTKIMTALCCGALERAGDLVWSMLFGKTVFCRAQIRAIPAFDTDQLRLDARGIASCVPAQIIAALLSEGKE